MRWFSDFERGEEGFERREDELRRWEAEGVGARGGDFAEVAGPGEDVLEDVAVDKAEVADFEAAGDGFVFKLDYADERELGAMCDSSSWGR